jgi:hypothetical protein
MPTFRNQIVVCATPLDVFQVLVRPATWPIWHPASRGAVPPRPSDWQLERGDAFDEAFVLAGWRGVASWKVTVCDPGKAFEVQGTAAAGGGVVRFALTTRGEGAGQETLVDRLLEYNRPNLLQRTLDNLVSPLVRRQQDIAMVRLKALVETGRVG